MTRKIIVIIMAAFLLSSGLNACKGTEGVKKTATRTPPQSTLEYLQRIPGLRVNQFEIAFRNGKVLTVLDGNIIQYSALLNVVNVHDIQSAKLLKEPVDILRYTTEAVTGILVVKTKSG